VNVAVGMNTDGNVTSATMLSLAKMWNAHPEFRSRLILHDGGCADFAGSRNRLVRAFLSTGIDWLLIVDADMVFEPEDWERLRDSADEAHPYVAGTYFVDNVPLRPAALIMKGDKRYTPNLREDSPELLEVTAASLGFGLVHRDVFLKSADPSDDHEWFAHGMKTPQGDTFPEDWAWCYYRVREAGIPIHLNTKVRIGHVKPRVIGWKEYISG
jgi:hypothetical protein